MELTPTPATAPPSDPGGRLTWFDALVGLLFGLAVVLTAHNAVTVTRVRALSSQLADTALLETPSALLVIRALPEDSPPARSPSDSSSNAPSADAPAVVPAHVVPPLAPWTAVALFASIASALLAMKIMPRLAAGPANEAEDADDAHPVRSRRTQRRRLMALLVAAVWSVGTTTGFFAVINNGLVAGWDWGPDRQAAKRTARHTLREDFLRHLGRLELPILTNLPATTRSRFDAECQQYLADHSDLAAVLATNSVEALFRFLDQSDDARWTRLSKELGLDAHIVPKGADSWFGFLSTSPIVRGHDAPPPIEAPSTDAVRQRLLPILRGAPDDPLIGARGGLAARIYSAELEAIHSSASAVFARRMNGPIQFLTVLPFLFGGLLIGWRVSDRVVLPLAWLRGYVHDHPILRSEIPLGPVVVHVLRRAADAAGDRVAEGVRLARQSVLAAYRGFLSNRNPNDGAQAVEAQSNYFMDRMVSEHAIIRFIAWVIPSIGFVGTVIGIGNALLKANKLVDPGARPTEALQGVVSELGVAFDTTFVALIASIILMLAFYWLQRREEQVILDVRQIVTDKIVRRFDRESLELGTVEFGFTLVRDDANNWGRQPGRPARYRARVSEWVGRDPLEGYNPIHPAWAAVRVFNPTTRPASGIPPEEILPQRGLMIEVLLGPAGPTADGDWQDAHLTDDGLAVLLDRYFQPDAAPPTHLRSLLEWCQSRPQAGGELADLRRRVMLRLDHGTLGRSGPTDAVTSGVAPGTGGSGGRRG